MYRQLGKRVSDSLLAALFLLVTWPLLAILAGSMTIVNRGNPFFVQPRPGRRGAVFRLIKFKTMTDRRDGTGQLLPDDQRLTPVGAWLRRTSLDELPQLLNVLLGDMSLVGPRPLLTDYWPLYSPAQHRRHHVRPGITGWAQVNGRNALSWDEKFAFDNWYVDNYSLRLDLTIMWLTVLVLTGRHPHGRSTTAPMPRFTGPAAL